LDCADQFDSRRLYRCQSLRRRIAIHLPSSKCRHLGQNCWQPIPQLPQKTAATPTRTLHTTASPTPPACDRPHQHTRNSNRHAFGYQRRRYPPLTAHIPTPAPAQPAAKAFCGGYAGCCVHDVHLLQHVIPIHSNSVCWPVPTHSNHPTDCRARASSRTRYTGQIYRPLTAASVHH